MVGKNILTKYIYLARTVYATSQWAGSMAALPGSRLCVNNNLVPGPAQCEAIVSVDVVLVESYLDGFLDEASMYPDALSNTETLLKLIWCLALMLCSTTADFSS
jgi:hypothetical protein